MSYSRAVKRATASLSIDRVLTRMVEAHALGGGAADVEAAVRRAACVYGSAPTCQLALQARTAGFSSRALDDAVLRARSLVRVRAMRGSVYLVPRPLLPSALALTTLHPTAHYAKMTGLGLRALETMAARIEALVAERPRTAAEIRAALGNKAPSGSALSELLGLLGRRGRIVRARVRGGARSQSYEYARMDDWLGGAPPLLPPLPEALRTLAPLWLAANGPATASDFAWWAGVGERAAAAALTAIGAQPVAVAGMAGDLLASADVLDALPRTAPNDDVHFLPLWDSYLMAHRDRRRYLDDAQRRFVVDRVGNVTNVIVRGGRVAGIWDLDGDTLLYAALATLPKRAVAAAAARLQPLHEVAKIVAVSDPRPLADGGQNAFLAPLKARRA
jgi:hypothetical protein